MRILFISAISSYKYGNTGLDYIAQYIRETSDDLVEIKYYHHHEDLEAIKLDIPKNYDIYGFSVFETNYLLFKKISSYLKQIKNNTIIIFGGQFVSMNYIQMISDAPEVDYFILGDGESPIKRIIDFHRVYRGRLRGDKSIASEDDYMDKQMNIEVEINRKASFDYYEYDIRARNLQKTHCMLTKSNICTGACTFCCSRKGPAIYKDVDRIVKEIEYLSKKFGLRKFFICDDDIFDIDCDERRERLNILLDRIKCLNLNLAFSGFAKPRSVCNPKNYNILQKMNEIGFHHLFLGIDAGNEADRQLYNKRSTLEENKKAIEILCEVGIWPRYGMIFINPYSTLETMRNSYQYLVELKSSNFYHYGGLRAQLLNGTSLLDMAKNDNLLTNDYSFINVEGYYFKHPEVQPIADFLEHELIPRADSVRYQFNTLKRKFELVRHINVQAEKYRPFVEQYEQKEFMSIKHFFYFLYEKNNLEYCREHLSEFINDMQENAKHYKTVIKDLDAMFISTPLEK